MSLPALVRFDAYATLSPADLEALMALASEPRTLAKGEPLQHEGDEMAAIHLLLDGWTGSSMTLPNGQRQLLKVHLTGDVIGLPSLPIGQAPDTVVALGPAIVSRLKLAEMGRLFVKRPRLAALLFLISQEERLMLMDRLTTVGRQDAMGRLAGFLLQLHARLRRQDPDCGDVIRSPLSQRDFADMIGTSMVHTHRTIEGLRARKLVRWQRGEITLLDRPALRALAGLPERVLARNQSWLPPPE